MRTAQRLIEDTIPQPPTPPSGPGAQVGVPADYTSLPLSGLARVVRRDWKNVNFAAKPYLDAMSQLGSIKDNYFMDPGREIVLYFLSNATTWRGPVAKAVKAELNRRLKNRTESKEHDYYTISADSSGDGFNVYGWSTYGRSSVLAGQPRKQFIDAFPTAEEAKAAFPDASFSSKWTEPEVSLSHLPGDEDPDPFGDNAQEDRGEDE